jgi:CRP/FNR family transcriptional regulator
MTMHIDCHHCAVRHRALCGVLSDQEIERMNRIARRRHIPAHQTILAEDETPDYFANVISGVVKLMKTLPDGRQQIVGLQFPSDFIGRPFGPRNPVHCEAASDVELCCYPRREFEALVKTFPDIEHRMFEHTLDELDAAREWMLLLGRKSAGEKVASFLLMIAKRMANSGCAPTAKMGFASFELPLSRAEIADYLGLTIETVSRQMTRLKTAGIIRIEHNRSISVPDMNRLEAAAEVEKADRL